MELLLNCIWLVLGLSLITFWSVAAHRPCAQRCTSSPAYLPGDLLVSRRLQFTALLLLVILLFPVISLTDDLAMCTAPRDAERALRLHDSFDGPQPSSALLPSTLAWMDAVISMLQETSPRPVDQTVQLARVLQGVTRPIESRPPPVAL